MYEDLEHALSLERFGRYLDWAGGDRERAIELYTLNSRLSESLYTPLQMLEVSLRNRVHAVMTEAHNENWVTDEKLLLGNRQLEQVKKAIDDIKADKKSATPGRIVAALTFSFWTSMFGPAYETLWQQELHKIVVHKYRKGLNRKSFSGPLTPIRLLRNRVAHHEPIIMWDLKKHYGNMVQLTEWLSPPAAQWCQRHSRFSELYPAERIVLAVSATV